MTDEMASQKGRVDLCSPIRVKVETKRLLDKLVSRANKKSYGRRILADDIIGTALELIEERHIEILQQGSMTNEDRFELERKMSAKRLGHAISKEEFLGILLGRQLPLTHCDSIALSSQNSGV